MTAVRCRWCDHPIRYHVHLALYVHVETGSRYCGLDESRQATP